MTRNLIVLFRLNKPAVLWYANGITVHPSDIRHLKTIEEVTQFLSAHGYTQPGNRCNPEALDYVMVISDWDGGLLIYSSDTEDN